MTIYYRRFCTCDASTFDAMRPWQRHFAALRMNASVPQDGDQARAVAGGNRAASKILAAALTTHAARPAAVALGCVPVNTLPATVSVALALLIAPPNEACTAIAASFHRRARFRLLADSASKRRDVTSSPWRSGRRRRPNRR